MAFVNLGNGDDVYPGTPDDDRIYGNGGNDVLNGAAGNDSIVGGNGFDELSGGDGDDTLWGGGGDQVLFVSRDGVGSPTENIDGGSGNDRMIVDYRNFVLTSGQPLRASVDISAGQGVVQVMKKLIGESFTSIEAIDFFGGDGPNRGVGGALNDNFTGGAGRDVFYGGGGNDFVSDSGGFLKADGGDGLDQLSLFRVDAVLPTVLKADAGILRIDGKVEAKFEGFESLKFAAGQGSARITGLSVGVNDLSGSSSDDTIQGGDLSDKLWGGSGNDRIYGGEGFDTIHGGAGDDRLYGGLGDDLIYTEGGFDKVYGGDGNDNVSLDLSQPTPGGVFNGGAGTDLLELEISAAPSFIDLSGWKLNGVERLWDGFTRFNAFEIVLTSAAFSQLSDVRFDATVSIRLADAGDAHLPGWSDFSRLLLADGGQRLDMSDLAVGFPKVVGGAGDDIIVGAAGTNVRSLDLAAGDDRLIAGTAQEKAVGGDGFDTVDYRKSPDGVTVSLDGITPGSGGLAAGDVLSGFERLIGSDRNDRLTGADAAEMLEGRGGRDRIDLGKGDDTGLGGAGRDILIGGRGDDTLTGGNGQDSFVFKNRIGHDLVTDFDPGADRIRLDDALWTGSLTPAEVVAAFAELTGGDVVFDFGNGQGLTLQGVTSLSGLETAIVLI